MENGNPQDFESCGVTGHTDALELRIRKGVLGGEGENLKEAPNENSARFSSSREARLLGIWEGSSQLFDAAFQAVLNQGCPSGEKRSPQTRNLAREKEKWHIPSRRRGMGQGKNGKRKDCGSAMESCNSGEVEGGRV